MKLRFRFKIISALIYLLSLVLSFLLPYKYNLTWYICVKVIGASHLSVSL